MYIISMVNHIFCEVMFLASSLPYSASASVATVPCIHAYVVQVVVLTMKPQIPPLRWNQTAFLHHSDLYPGVIL